jgi:hypothetical protein
MVRLVLRESQTRGLNPLGRPHYDGAFVGRLYLKKHKWNI